MGKWLSTAEEVRLEKSKFFYHVQLLIHLWTII